MTNRKTFQDLIDLVTRLRAPDGCPWDREQTYTTLGPMLIEEAWEVVEASESEDRSELRDELGDLLFQIIFYAHIAAEQKDFDIQDAITSVHEKMTRRHPHVFGDVKVSSTAEVLANWEAIKAVERESADRAAETGKSLLDGVSSMLPSLLEAFQLTTRAARVGFDWKSLADVFVKMDEELQEVRTEVEREPRDMPALAGEIGDLLFVIVNVARKLGVEPEVALKSTNRKFRRRFRYVEQTLAAKGKTCAESGLEEMDGLWDEAKMSEGENSTQGR
jgi:tetrapyrrole methylase family protein/MazG family protein/ATP diphosphatase